MITHDDMRIVLGCLIVLTGVALLGLVLLGWMAYDVYRQSRVLEKMILEDRNRRGTAVHKGACVGQG